MKAIFIDPMSQTVEYMDVPRNVDIPSIIRDVITIAHMYDNGDTLYVSDNGLLEMEPAMQGKTDAFRAFMFDVGAHQPFAGYGLLVGDEDDVGNVTDVKTDIEDIRRVISFFGPAAASAHGPKH